MTEYVTWAQEDPTSPVWLSDAVIARGMTRAGIRVSAGQVRDALQRLARAGQVVRIKMADGRMTWAPAPSVAGIVEMSPDADPAVRVFIDPDPLYGREARWLSGWDEVIRPIRRDILAALSAPEHPFRVVPRDRRLSAWIHHFLFRVPAIGAAIAIRDPKRFLYGAIHKTEIRDAKHPDWHRTRDQVTADVAPEAADGIASGAWIDVTKKSSGEVI